MNSNGDNCEKNVDNKSKLLLTMFNPKRHNTKNVTYLGGKTLCENIYIAHVIIFQNCSHLFIYYSEKEIEQTFGEDFRSRISYVDWDDLMKKGDIYVHS